MNRSICDMNKTLLCNVCGLFTPTRKQIRFTENIIAKYTTYYGCDPKINVQFAPKRLCRLCYDYLNRNKTHLLPVQPMLWNESDKEHTDCFSCLLPSLNGIKWSDRTLIKYPDTSSSLRAVYGSTVDSEPAVEESESRQTLPTVASTSSVSQSSSFHPSASTSKNQQPKLISQAFFNDLVRDLKLSSRLAELLGSRLREQNLLEPGTRTSFRSTFQNFRAKFKESDGITYLCDLNGLFELYNIVHVSQDWRLFIDGSVSSLKAVLIHNENVHPSIPVAYSTTHKDEYGTLKKILDLINYTEYAWKIVADFKLINILMGLKKGSPKYPCFICHWDKNSKLDKYTEVEWQKRPDFKDYPDDEAEKYSALTEPLINSENIILPPLHIKLGLITQLFKKLISRNNSVEKELLKMFPKVSKQKIYQGIFDGPKIREIFKNEEFEKILDVEEMAAFSDTKQVCDKFLGNERAENYKELIGNMMKSFKKLGINVTLKMHTLISHLDRFPENLGRYSDEQGERAHQDFKSIEARFKGKNNTNAIGTYCWQLYRDENPSCHKRRSRSKMQHFH